MTPGELKASTYAAIFPEMRPEDYSALKASISESGLHEPIVLLEGKILDGCHRYRACRELGAEPQTVDYRGKDPLGYVLAKNLNRRHLSESQRGLIAARLADMTQGARTDLASIDAKSQGDAAASLGVGRATVQRARVVLARGSQELVQAVESGNMAVSAAAKLARADRPRQVEILTIKDKKTRAQATKDAAAHESSSAVTPCVPKEFGERAKSITLDQWSKMTAPEHDHVLASTQGKQKFNTQKTDSVEWARSSWNPITGCLHGCQYCYARDLAERFYEGGFEPAIHPGRLSAPQNTRVPTEATADVSFKNVFTCSMADLFGEWVPRGWIEAVLKAAGENPQWNYLFLTKNPRRLSQFEIPDNAWMGTTVDRRERVDEAERAMAAVRCKVRWLSCEPMLEPLRFKRLDLFQWVVIGGASPSTKTPAWVPPLDWMVDLHWEARKAGCCIYYKTNSAMPDSLRIREFPWRGTARKTLPPALCHVPVGQGLSDAAATVPCLAHDEVTVAVGTEGSVCEIKRRGAL